MAGEVGRVDVEQAYADRPLGQVDHIKMLWWAQFTGVCPVLVGEGGGDPYPAV
ncbi:hypothetical protein [Streptomyces sp. NPDC002994]|uniref:hypothetical protein n=1 Tax=Streptomyces sp. NPDC002994 TaxID=3154441 RepID=UPI0033AE3EF3